MGNWRTFHEFGVFGGGHFGLLKMRGCFFRGNFMDSDSRSFKVTFLKKSAFYIFLRGCSIILHHTLGVKYRNLCQDFQHISGFCYKIKWTVWLIHDTYLTGYRKVVKTFYCSVKSRIGILRQKAPGWDQKPLNILKQKNWLVTQCFFIFSMKNIYYTSFMPSCINF